MAQSGTRAPEAWTSGVQLVAGFTVLHLSVATAWAIIQQRQEFLLYLALTPILLAVIARIHARIRLSEGLLWCLSLLTLLHMAGGLIKLPSSMPVEERHLLYDWWLIPEVLKYDHLVHAFGNALATWLCWQLLQRTVASKTGWAFRDLKPTPELLFFCILAGMGIGSGNEIIEFIATKLVRDHGVGGYANTLMDLVSNTIGSLSVAAILWNHGRRTCDPSTGLVCRSRS